MEQGPLQELKFRRYRVGGSHQGGLEEPGAMEMGMDPKGKLAPQTLPQQLLYQQLDIWVICVVTGQELGE